MRGAYDQALQIRPTAIGIGDPLDDPPEREAEQADRDQADDPGTERADEHRLKRALAVAGPAAPADGRQQGEGADHAVDDAAGAVAEPGKALQGVAAEMQERDSHPDAAHAESRW